MVAAPARTGAQYPKDFKLKTSKRVLLASSVLSGAAMFFTSAVAQEVAPEAAVAEEVVVTGTRIRLKDYVASNPVTSITSETVELSGQTNVTQFLQEVPALVNSVDVETGADANSNFDGLSLLNLRNLGVNRTLVLVDGRRHVGSNPGTSAVDVSAIPVALIDRTEILTGGASAIYGADGVTGVVNFILKKDFEGVDLRAQTGWSQEGGGENYFLSGLIGDNNFADGRGNITLGFEYDKTEDLKFADREFTRSGNLPSLLPNPEDGDLTEDRDGDGEPEVYDDGIPDFIPVRGGTYADTSLIGSVYSNYNTAQSNFGVGFLTNGEQFAFSPYYGFAIEQSGSGTPTDLFNDDLIPGQERYSLYSTGSFELNDRHELFGEVKYTNSQVNFEGQPSYDYGLFISEENPFIPDVIRADAAAPGGLIDDPEGNGLPSAGVLLARDNFYLGRSMQDTENETFRAVGGVRGDLPAGLEYEVSYVFGRANQTIDYANVRLNDRYYAATDVVVDPATGQPTCRTNLQPTVGALGDLYGQFQYGSDVLASGATFTPGPNSGCRPLNVFAASPDAAAIDWVMGEGTAKAELTQHVLNAFVTGDTESWFSLPAGAISFVFGGEYRKEKSTTTPDVLQAQAESIGYANLTGLGRVVPTNGEYDVTELFTEISVPILRDMPFAEELTVSGAYRYSNYSTIGLTDTWNVAARYRPVRDVMFRGTVARAVRAPNINDLFRGRQQTFQGFSDPCSQENLKLGDNPSQRQANCAAALTALGIDPATYRDTSSETTAGFLTGNPNLKAEEADTKTFGFVLNPRFVPGLSFSLDYYDVEITDAIASYSVQSIVNNCYDLPAGNEFCSLIERSGPEFIVNPGRIRTFDQVPGNLSSFRTAGYDFTLRYNLDPSRFGVERDVGTFSFGLVGNKLEKLERLETVDAPINDDKGEEGAPEWQATFDTTWSYNKLTVNYGISWFDQTSRYSNVEIANNSDIAPEEWKFYEERFVQDLQVRYELSDQFEVYAGVNNLGNQEPQPSGFGDASYPVSSLGRFFYVGASAKLGGVASLWPFR